MRKQEGRIIAVVGSIGSGKSFLVRGLEGGYRIKAFYEGETGDFPDFLKDNLANGSNYLQTELYFLNQNIRHYVRAVSLKREGHDVVLDTYWMTIGFFLGSVLTDPNEFRLMTDMIASVSEMLPPPDDIVFLDASDRLLAERIARRGRSFEGNVLPIAVDVSREHRKFLFGEERPQDSRLTVIDPESYDLHELAKGLGLTER
ncbi:deoxynucleoside kinase [Candidatus Uhrbacteria bacterium]|nr:deoxynucleoside kinase [Candidatus Uhrbacteria bacterium]